MSFQQQIDNDDDDSDDFMERTLNSINNSYKRIRTLKKEMKQETTVWRKLQREMGLLNLLATTFSVR